MFNFHHLYWILILAVIVQFTFIESVVAKAFVDPTRPPGVNVKTHKKMSVAKYSAWRLNSTLISADREIATINGKLIRRGENINGATLVNIYSLYVTLKKNEKLFKVYMFKKMKVNKVSR